MAKNERESMATYAVTSEDGREVYVYVRGQFVMKRWLATGMSATFHVAPLGVQRRHGEKVWL